MSEPREKPVVRLPLTEGNAGVAAGAAHGITPEIIAAVVDEFYAKCRAHAVLGPVFESRVEDWPAHLARIRAFWEAALLRTGGYGGRPLEAHLAIPNLSREHFAAWLRLFNETVRAHCTPGDAAVFMDRAGRMANRIMGVAWSERGE